MSFVLQSSWVVKPAGSHWSLGDTISQDRSVRKKKKRASNSHESTETQPSPANMFMAGRFPADRAEPDRGGGPRVAIPESFVAELGHMVSSQ